MNDPTQVEPADFSTASGGSLSDSWKTLGKVAHFYEDEVDASIQALTSIIEPTYMPMFKMLTLIK